MNDKPKSEEGKKAPPEKYDVLQILPLWQLDIVEVTGKNLEAKGREEVNELLSQGWILLYIYTLVYQEDDIWRERPMAILGLSKKK